MRSTASWVARYGVMVALAIILSYVELLFPINFVVPGVKLGLANLVTIVGLYLVGERGTACVTSLPGSFWCTFCSGAPSASCTACSAGV